MKNILVVKSKNYNQFSTPCKSGKEEDAVTYWLQVQFRKGDEPSKDKIRIDVEEGFFSCFAHKDGKVDPKLIVMKWFEVEEKTTDDHKRK